MRSKRLTKTVTTRTGVILSECWCRKCMQMKKPTEFYEAVDNGFLDGNGRFSICKDDCNKIYNSVYESEKNLERALLRTCRLLNIRYDERAVQALQKHLDTLKEQGKDAGEKTFGLYKMKLTSVSKGKFDNRDSGEDLTFEEPSREVYENLSTAAIDDQDYYNEKWGTGLVEDDYYFLESEYSRWEEKTDIDNYSIEILVREICHKMLEIRKARIEQKSVDGLVKALQELMKNSALTPVLQNAAANGKNQVALGIWIKDLETKGPAEWWQDQKKYQDIDGIRRDINNIIRSTKNFVTGSRDFTTGEIEEINDETEDVISNIMED